MTPSKCSTYLQIKYRKTYCRSSRPEVFCKKVSLKNFTKFTRRYLWNKLKINFKMNLTIDSSTVMFSCQSYEIFKSTYFLEHLRTSPDFTTKEPNADAKIWAILIFFIIKEHKFIKSVLDEDNLKTSDTLKTRSHTMRCLLNFWKCSLCLKIALNARKISMKL